MSEFELIEKLKQRNTTNRNDVIQGIGDDCARVTIPADYELAITTDTLISGVHFPLDTSPEAIGYKSLAVNLSDLAAMGAEPAWVTLAMSMPDANTEWLDKFTDGFFALANQYNLQLIGGDITKGPLSITIQAHGLIPKGKALTRSGAQIGDYICITGTLGDAGWELFNRPKRGEQQNRLDYPSPRVSAGLALRELATSAIDISDGLIADLGHVLNASQVGANIVLQNIPLSQQSLNSDDLAKILELALTAGDDYELCFTIAEANCEKLEALQKELELRITPIGTIEKESGIRILRQDGTPLEIASSGYNHFSEKKRDR